MIYCDQFIEEEVPDVFGKNKNGQVVLWCRMLISRACSMAEASGSFAAHLISAQR